MLVNPNDMCLICKRANAAAIERRYGKTIEDLAGSGSTG